MDYSQRIAEMEKELGGMQYNKRTQHHYGLVRAKIAQLREKQESRSRQGGKHDGFEVRRTGDGTVILLGFPSTGKSTLLNALTNANSEVGAYEFTTLTCVPGVLQHNHAKIQVLDVPGIVQGASTGRGKGREVLAAMRSADLALIVVDATRPAHLPVIKKEVYDVGIRLDQHRPDVRIRKKAKDGIRIGRTVLTPLLDDQTIVDILKEFRINNAEVLIRDVIDADQFIDCIEGNKKYMPSVVALNKIDLLSPEDLRKLVTQLKPDLCISAKNNEHLDELKDVVFRKLDLIRVCLKEPGKEADVKEPMIMFRGCTIQDVCSKLHKEFVKKFKYSRVWGQSAKFPGQRLMLGHVLGDQDILELHMN